MAEGGVIASIADIQKSRSELITPLFGWMQLQQARSADSLARRQVMIQTDRELPFEIVKRVMYTCSKAGFDDYAILVIQEE
jgi:biopolymer transport protein ExbD